jgi:monofunctional glycosyltransferase
MTRNRKNYKKPEARPARSQSRLAQFIRYIFRIIRNSVIVVVTAAAVLVLLFKVINPPASIYIVSEWWRLGGVKREWTRMEDFPDYVPRSIVAAEDANFCLHSGFDFKQIKSAISGKGKLRGASTLSQQVSKNVFLWQGRSWVRKGLEAGFTVLVELFWSKERILEVYMNVAEFDEGVFGVAAAGRHYFGVNPENITQLQAARLAAILPSPKKRSASLPTGQVRKRTAQILSGVATLEADGRAKCFQ